MLPSHVWCTLVTVFHLIQLSIGIFIFSENEKDGKTPDKKLRRLEHALVGGRATAARGLTHMHKCKRATTYIAAQAIRRWLDQRYLIPHVVNRNPANSISKIHRSVVKNYVPSTR